MVLRSLAIAAAAAALCHTKFSEVQVSALFFNCLSEFEFRFVATSPVVQNLASHQPACCALEATASMPWLLGFSYFLLFVLSISSVRAAVSLSGAANSTSHAAGSKKNTCKDLYIDKLDRWSKVCSCRACAPRISCESDTVSRTSDKGLGQLLSLCSIQLFAVRCDDLCWGAPFQMYWAIGAASWGCRIHPDTEHSISPLSRIDLLWCSAPLYLLLQHPRTFCAGAPYYGDGPKFVCGMEFLTDKADCLVYSIGSRAEDGFELDLLSRAPNCEVSISAATAAVLQRHAPQQQQQQHRKISSSSALQRSRE
eukprot:3406-Heterococcus_DN1.PRE.2